MAENTTTNEKLYASLGFEVIRNRVKIEALVKTLADADLIDKDVYVNNFNEIYEKRHEQYAADLLDLSTEEFRKMIKPK